MLSGYGYLRGAVVAGVVADGQRKDTRAEADARLSVATAALPGGDLALGTFEGAFGARDAQRLQLRVFEGAGMFVCHDTQSGKLFAPMQGMFSHECEPDAVTAFDFGLVTMQWNASSGRVLGEWIRMGPAFELLGNGLSYAHLRRSLVLALPLDLRSVIHGNLAEADPTSFGAGLRLAAFVRTPHWETRLDLRHRSAVAGGAGLRHDNGVQAELRLLHNFFLLDALVIQAGVSLRAAWSQRPQDALVVWATNDRWSGFAGLYVGWVNESPDI
jgi:hypothetical protein